MSIVIRILGLKSVFNTTIQPIKQTTIKDTNNCRGHYLGHNIPKYDYLGHNNRRYGYLGHKFEYRLFVVLLFSTDWEFLTAGGSLDLIEIQIS